MKTDYIPHAIIGLGVLALGASFFVKEDSNQSPKDPLGDGSNRIISSEVERSRTKQVTGSRDPLSLKPKGPKVKEVNSSLSKAPLSNEIMVSRSSGSLSRSNPRTSREIGIETIPLKSAGSLKENLFIRKWPSEYYTWNNKRQWKYRKSHSQI